MAEPGPILEERVLVLAPTLKDASLCCTILADVGVASVACPDVAAVSRETAVGAGAWVLTEEALTPAGFDLLVTMLSDQPEWSDLPVLVLTQQGANSEVALRTLETLGNVTLLERPVRVPALVSAVRTALRARRRQYQIRNHLTEVRRAAESLREADRQKNEFLAMLAHELRNPLAPIRNSLEILRMKGGDPRVECAGAMIARQVEHMVRLVDDLLDVSRILRGRIELRPDLLDLAAVIARATETARPLIDALGHNLTVAFPAAPVHLRGDPVRLAQVFANLLNNAAKYTEPNGEIRVTAERDGDDVVVRVRDNGVGIAADTLPRVFDLFAQAERSLDRSQGGLGVGLTLVRQMVEMHGGTVTAASAGPGQGSEFVVRLPATNLAVCPPRARHERPRVVAGRASRRVLIVDDNTDAADSLAALLSLVGHEVDIAYSGPAALTSVQNFQPEVVFLDIGLPGMDGYQVARKLREGIGPSGLLLVAMTGYGQDEDRRRSREAGFDHHLVKPVDLMTLQPVLAEVPSP